MTALLFRNLAYLGAAILFILGLKMLTRPETARRGNRLSALGMLIAIVATLTTRGLSFQWILAGLAVGGIIGAVAAQAVKMTGMPEMVALFNGFGGGASLLVGCAEYLYNPQSPAGTLIAVAAAVLIGGVTFSGSLVAVVKLAGFVSGKPLLFRGQKLVNGLLLAGAILCGAGFAAEAGHMPGLLAALIILALILGIGSTIPIGGADMPVVIALLNSYSGLAACAAGFVLLNTVLIVSGSLVGASGLILTGIMCRAMNRSIGHVLFAGVGVAAGKAADQVQGEARPISPQDAYLLLEAAQHVAIVPGYGMAVAQAQHAVSELGELLQANGCQVSYVIHPVAGRMPGHMNVLLAEANVPYDLLAEPQDVNPTMQSVDVALVIGANDVVNPAAREDASSAIYGMPIVNVDQAKTCIVLKRTLSAGFSGVDNPLFFKPNTRMLFGDAKASVAALVAEFKGT